ncbi:hypothetical protein [Flammeovirga agarivorans]|uniref:PH domain-containing protein n=1 Tax=Flammeovirga agarivorans TaxID=2726742 RepID=A0A7X8SRF1_9BACT|nr:hypothetical protein [Flammeovirga agarivorans]NLR94914.1 hypothetical protein [Flammeovirga agarivorans]
MITKETKEQVEEWVKALSMHYSELMHKNIICNCFMKNRLEEFGDEDKCEGCSDPSIMSKCKKEFLLKISARPQLEWSATWDAPVKRTKKIPAKEIGISCVKCYMNTSCPYFEESSECAFDWESESMKELSPKEIIKELIDIQSKRIAVESAAEKTDGGKTDMILSGEIDRMAKLADLADRMGQNRQTLTIQASSTSKDETSKPAGGILASFFGKKTEEELPEKAESIEEIPHEEITTEEKDPPKEVIKRKRIKRNK